MLISAPHLQTPLTGYNWDAEVTEAASCPSSSGSPWTHLTSDNAVLGDQQWDTQWRHRAPAGAGRGSSVELKKGSWRKPSLKQGRSYQAEGRG